MQIFAIHSPVECDICAGYSGSEGFLSLANRLMGQLTSKINNKKKPKPVNVTAGIRDQLDGFCLDAGALNAFYRQAAYIVGKCTRGSSTLEHLHRLHVMASDINNACALL